MALKTLARPVSKAAVSNPQFTYFGMAAKVIEVVEIDDDRVSLKVENLIEAGGIKKGQVVDVKFNDWHGKDIKCTESLNRGLGRAPGSILMLENCRMGEGGVVVANWLKAVAFSAMKDMSGDKRHKQRTLHEGFVTQPVISFGNPEAREGEAAYIVWPIMAEKQRLLVEVKGKWTRKEYDRAFVKDRLAKALGDGAAGAPGVRIESSVYEADKAVSIASMSQLSEELVKVLEGHNASALLRVVDDDGAVFTRRVDLPYNKETLSNADPAVIVSALLEKDIFGFWSRPEGAEREVYSTIPNEAVAEGLNANEVHLEIIPIRNVPYLGKNNQSSRMQLINSFINKEASQMDDFAVPYGVGDGSVDRAVRMVTIEEPVASGGPGRFLVGTPMALSKDSFSVANIPTAHFAGTAPANETSSEPHVTEDYIDGSGYELVAPSDQAPETVETEAPKAEEPEAASTGVRQVRSARRF